MTASSMRFHQLMIRQVKGIICGWEEWLAEQSASESDASASHGTATNLTRAIGAAIAPPIAPMPLRSSHKGTDR